LASDGHPVARRDYYAYLAQLLGVPCPAFVAPASDLPAAQRARANKRVNNGRLRTGLGVRFQYPSYREGLRASLEKAP
jgi:hypothetical protein